MKDLLERHKKKLPESTDSDQRRELLGEKDELLRLFRFGSAPLARILSDGTKRTCPTVVSRRDLAKGLNNNLARLFKKAWAEQRFGFEQDFRGMLEKAPAQLTEEQQQVVLQDLEEKVLEFSQTVDADGVGGTVAGCAKRQLRTSLTKFFVLKCN